MSFQLNLNNRNSVHLKTQWNWRIEWVCNDVAYYALRQKIQSLMRVTWRSVSDSQVNLPVPSFLLWLDCASFCSCKILWYKQKCIENIEEETILIYCACENMVKRNTGINIIISEMGIPCFVYTARWQPWISWRFKYIATLHRNGLWPIDLNDVAMLPLAKSHGVILWRCMLLMLWRYVWHFCYRNGHYFIRATNLWNVGYM